MTATGWIAEEPDPGPALPVTAFIIGQRAAAAGPVTLEQVFARAAAATDKTYETPGPDEDERASSLLGRGYQPGALSQLMGQLGDVQAELQGEKEKLEKGAQRAAWIHREHQAARLSAFDVMRMMDGLDEGDENRVRQLEHRAQSLRHRIADATETVAPPERRDPDPLAAAAQRAHAAFAELTRSRMAEVQERARQRPEPRPFASASRGAGRSTEHTGDDRRVSSERRRYERACAEIGMPVCPVDGQVHEDAVRFR